MTRRAYDLLKPVIEAVGRGDFALASVLVIIPAVALTRRYLPDGFGGKFARGDVGGMVAAFFYAAAGSSATALMAPGVHFTSSVALAALKFGLGAIGGFVALHKLAVALVATKWWNEKAPAPLKFAVSLVLKFIGSDAQEQAKAAGDAAVKEKPATGSGEFTDVQ
jgi:hypothetical protein